MHITVNINTDVTAKLEKIHRSALPIAVRNTLNRVAFEMKKETLPSIAAGIFEKRNPNFFKANSRVEMAKGFNVNNMASMVAMVSSGLKGGSNYAVEDLEQQEKGGTINKKSMIPMDTARAGKSPTKAVRPMNRLGGLQNLVNARNARGKNKGQQFIKSAIYAGVGGYVLADFKDNQVIWRVNSLNRIGKNKSFKLTALYSYKPDRKIRVKGTGFMKKSALQSGENIQDYFFLEAEKQFAKYAK